MSDALARMMLAHGATNLWWTLVDEAWIDIADGPSGGKHLDLYNTAGLRNPLMRSHTAGPPRFDGYSVYAKGDGTVDFPNPHVTQNWSLEFWARFDSSTTLRSIYQRGSTTNGVFVQTRNTTTPGIDVAIKYNSAEYKSRIPGGSINADEAAHVAISFATDTITSYVNGSVITPGVGTLSVLSNSNLLIGDSSASNSQWMLGWLGPIAQYQNVALTAQQVADHYRVARSWIDYAHRLNDPAVTLGLAI